MEFMNRITISTDCRPHSKPSLFLGRQAGLGNVCLTACDRDTRTYSTYSGPASETVLHFSLKSSLLLALVDSSLLE